MLFLIHVRLNNKTFKLFKQQFVRLTLNPFIQIFGITISIIGWEQNTGDITGDITSFEVKKLKASKTIIYIKINVIFVYIFNRREVLLDWMQCLSINKEGLFKDGDTVRHKPLNIQRDHKSFSLSEIDW